MPDAFGAVERLDLTSPPSAACTIGTSSTANTSGPWRSNTGSSSTSIDRYRSPGGPPARPACPPPLILSSIPSVTPAGTSIGTTVRAGTRPRPSQRSHGVDDLLPVPWQVPHGCAVMTVPKMLRRTSCTWPDPLHVWHRCGVVPGCAPLPWQTSQVSIRPIWTSRRAPNAASLNPSPRSANRSSPGWARLRRPPRRRPNVPVPKNASNRSGDVAERRLHRPAVAVRRRSGPRLSASERISYAPATSLKRCSAWGSSFTSGWNSRARRRYAVRMSSVEASRPTPRIS